MAQIINKKSKEIIHSIRAQGYSFVSLKQKGLFFSKPASMLCGFSEGKFIHFVNDSNYWAFYVNDDSDGFTLTPDDDGESGFIVYGTQLSRLFKQSVGAKLGERFFINETKSLQNDSKVFEIQTISTVEVILDKVTRMNEQRKLEKQYVLNIKHQTYKRKKLHKI